MATVAWVSQTFLQLVLLSVIMVGQDISAQKAERRAEKTYRDTEEILKMLKRHQEMISESMIVPTKARRIREKNLPPALDSSSDPPHPW